MVALLAEIGVRAVKQEPVEEGEVGDYEREENGAVKAGGVYGPAVVEEEFEEGELLVWGGGEDVVGGLAEDRRARGEEIACDVDVASAKGDGEAVMEEGACAG